MSRNGSTEIYKWAPDHRLPLCSYEEETKILTVPEEATMLPKERPGMFIFHYIL